MLADEADNPGFLLLLEQVALTSLFPLSLKMKFFIAAIKG